MSKEHAKLAAETARPIRALTAAALAAALAWAAPVSAQLPIPATTQFDITGHLQSATLDAACASSPHCGGTVKVNGHTIVIPRETIVMLPANALTWQELFAQAPAPYGLATLPPSTGLAAADLPAPLTSYEIHVVGNRVIAGGQDRYIAGLVNIAQVGLFSGAGFVNFIDYATGELRVGGLLGDRTTGTRVRINDPAGRFGRVSTPDGRFTVDAENPTVTASTAYPMCIPRTDPAVSDDPLCPQGNRPITAIAGTTTIYATNFTTNDPISLPGQLPDPTRQAPFEVGDYVTFSGTVVKDTATTPTTGPWPADGGPVGTFVSAHTLTNNVAIYTWPGTDPAYVNVEVALIGTGGTTVLGGAEAAVRTKFEGMTTDPARNIHLYGVDVDPLTGATTDRDWGMTGVDPGPPVGAVRGRWRYTPPCTATFPDSKVCTPPPGGTWLPAPREVRAVIEGAWVPGQTTAYANGIVAGQYHAPISEFIFPENIPGAPIVANNFATIPFLAQGGYTSSAGTVVGQLSPFPDAVTPPAACTLPVAVPGGPYSVASGGTVTLAGSASGSGTPTFSWAAPAQGTLSSLAVANPVYTAPLVAAPLAVTLTLTVTNPCGTATATTTVTVNASLAPTMNHTPAMTAVAGIVGNSLPISGTDPNGQLLSFTVTQTGAPALTAVSVVNVVKSGNTTSALVRFTTPPMPAGQLTPFTINLSITARNAAGVASTPDLTTVTVKPAADVITIGNNVEYRTTKQRLTINATSTVVSPNLILTLKPYVTTSGATFDPALFGATFTNNGNGTYTLVLVGVPQPAVAPATPIQVFSNIGGLSAPHIVDRVRL